MKNELITWHSLCNFFVSILSAFIVTACADNVYESGRLIVLYLFCALFLQLPIGIYADKKNKNEVFAMSGVGIILATFFLALYGDLYGEYIYLVAALVGVGNAVFHVGAGIDILNVSDKNATVPAIFISAEVFGLFLGLRAIEIANTGSSLILYGMVLLGILAIVLLAAQGDIRKGLEITNSEYKFKPDTKQEEGLLISVILAIVATGFVGRYFVEEIVGYGTVIDIACVLLGILIGGILRDKIGFKKIIIASLVGSDILFIYSAISPVFGLLGLLLFCMSIPTMLMMLVNTFYEAKGQMLGVMTAALFVGFTICEVVYVNIGWYDIFLLASPVVVLVALLYGIKLYDANQERLEKLEVELEQNNEDNQPDIDKETVVQIEKEINESFSKE